MRNRLLDQKLRLHLRRYVAQVVLAMLALVGVLWAEELIAGAEVARAVAIGAVASTAFVLFISPHRDTSLPRHVLGGHALGLLIASTLTLLVNTPLVQGWVAGFPALFAITSAVAVGAVMFAMAATNTEHAPAAGTALAIAAHGFNWQLIVFIGISIVGLAIFQRLIRDWLINLY